jgi:coenzyme F420 biosynthesis associated uncharacterized protein
MSPDARPGAVSLVDWSAAASVAGRLARPGPTAARADLDLLVAGLREAANRAVGPVEEVTGLVPADPAAPLSDVYVVDRPRWARANTEVMDHMTRGALDDLLDDAQPVTALVGGAQVGATLALLSSRVLGQFDPYSRPDGPGRLLLVAPNVLGVERQLGVDPADFRLWVCLHEQTHALQFASTPWLADHLAGQARDLIGDVARSSKDFSEARVRDKLATVGRAVLAAVRGEGQALLTGLVDDEQKQRLADVTAVMALLEGHADVAMDAVGPALVPSVAHIRARFEARRDSAGTRADQVLRRLLGMDAKIAQYRDGAAFVREVTQRVGQEGLNAVWTSPDTLPTAREIADPRAWVRRVHG